MKAARAGIPLDTPRRRAAARRALRDWYRRTARDLPWRRTRDPYRVWLSEIMLQQTQVATVTPYYERFVAAFSTVAALAAAPLDHVLRLWEGLGYYTRARNLHRAAQLVQRERDGCLPRNAAEWQSLPGVGRYTANAIASIAFDEPVATVDGNIRRVLARLYALEMPLDGPAGGEVLWSRAEELLDRRSPGAFNQALMELGARVCVPRGPHCGECPVQRWCAARADARVDELPRRRTRRAVPQVEAAAALLTARGRCLLVRRAARGLLGGLWTVPMVELTDGVAAKEALAASLRDSMGWDAADLRPIGRVRHVFTHRRLTVQVFAGVAPKVARTNRGTRPAEARWVSRKALADYPCAALDRKLFALLD